MVANPSPHLYTWKNWQRDHGRWLAAGKSGAGQIQLRGENLRGIVAVGADLRFARLVGCDLSGASLNSATLNMIELVDCVCEETVMHGSDINEARLENCQARGANLMMTNLHR